MTFFSLDENREVKASPKELNITEEWRIEDT